MTLSAYDQAMAAATALPLEDGKLFLQTFIERLPVERCPDLFSGRPVEDVELIVLWLVLGFDPLDQADMLWAVVEHVVDQDQPEATRALVRLAEWIHACLRSSRA